MRKKWLVLPAVAVIILLVVGSAFARRSQGRRDGGLFGGRWLAMMEQRLQLTPQQSQQVQGILSAQRERMRQEFAGGQGRNARHELVKQLFRDNPSQGDIQQRVQALQQQHEQMLNQMVSTGLEINKVLTSEQRAELQKAFEEQAQKRGQWRQRMGERKSQRESETPNK